MCLQGDSLRSEELVLVDSLSYAHVDLPIGYAHDMTAGHTRESDPRASR